MAMSVAELGEKCGAYMNDARMEWQRLGMLQRHIDGKLVNTWMPSDADLEYKDVLRKSVGPWLAFVRDAIAQGIRIDGYSDDDVWKQVWQANNMDGRQGAINREVVGLGRSFLMTIPRKNVAGATQVVMRPLSARHTFAVYDDPWDEYPSLVLSRLRSPFKGPFWDGEWAVFDNEAMYRFEGSPGGPRNVEVTEHGFEYTPVVKISNSLTLDGKAESSVERLIPIYKRIVDATFTLQMTMRYGAFPQKWMAGGEIARDATGKPLLRSSVDGLIHAEGASGETARFGTFAAAVVADVVAGVDANIRDLAATAQIPPHYLLGNVINMSAEGIAAAETGYQRNIEERKEAMGEGYELGMRTAAALLGLEQSAQNTSSQVHFQDVAARSLAQAADAVQKLGALDAPLELLFALVPGWTKTDAMEAAAYARQQQAVAAAQAQQIAQAQAAAAASRPAEPSQPAAAPAA